MKLFFSRPLRLLCLLPLLWLMGSPSAQAQSWQWATSPGGGTNSSGRGTAMDATGNVYITGTFTRTATFGTTTLTSAGGEDIFVAKLNSSGTYQWAIRAGGNWDDSGNGVAVDSSGNVVFTGSFDSPVATFGSMTLTNAGYTNLFVAKLTPGGAWQWVSSAGGTTTDIGTSVAVDSSSNVVVTGGFGSPMVAFGTTTLTNRGGLDIFVAKLTPSGAWQWATSAGGSSNDSGSSIDIDNNSRVVVTGYFGSPTITFGATALTSAGGADIFVAKLTDSGTYQWAVGAGGSGVDVSHGVAVDSNDNVLFTGTFDTPGAAFGPTMLTNAGTVSYSLDIFVAKLTPGGVWQWAIGTGGGSSEGGGSVAVDDSGNIIVTGYFISPTVSFGPITLTNASAVGFPEVFVTRLTGSGTYQLATSAGGTGGDIGRGIAVDGNGNMAVTGNFGSGTVAFGSTTITNTTASAAIFISYLSTATGLPESATTPTFALAPNPAHATATLTGANAKTATLLNALGRVVRTVSLSAGAATLDVRGLPAGLYLVRAGGAARRLVVE